MVMLGPQISAHFATGNLPELLGNQSPTKNPTANVFATADGYVQIVALKQAQTEALFDVLGLSELLEDSRFATARDRTQHAAAVIEQVAPKLARESTAHWIEALTRAEVPVAPIRDLREVVVDPQFEHRDCFVPVRRANGDATHVVGAGHRSNVDGPRLRSEPPQLGADTQAVLAELGFSAEEIDGFRARGAI